jgi:hypothetical protein
MTVPSFWQSAAWTTRREEMARVIEVIEALKYMVGIGASNDLFMRV